MDPKSHLKLLTDSAFPQRGPVRVASDDQQKSLIVEQVALGLSITAAARKVGLSRLHISRMMTEDPQFAEQVEDAYQQGTDYLEDLALVRAHESDQVLMKLLESRRPEKYSSRRSLNAGVKIVINSLSSTPPPISIEHDDSIASE